MRDLAHPVRVHALHILNQREASPEELAAEIGVSVEKVAYHVGELKKAGFVDLVRIEPRDGAVEEFFEGTKQAHFTEQEWAEVPEAMRSAIVSMELRVTDELLDESLRSGAFERRPSRHHSLQQGRVDAEAWRAAMSVLHDAMGQVEAICREGEARLDRAGERGIGLAVSMIGFETD